jgi:nucleotide-binding universal stress UspA family protein
MALDQNAAENSNAVEMLKEKVVPNKILVPVDGSAAALRALEFAKRRKQDARGGVTILVLNVQLRLPPSRYVTRSMIKDHYGLMATLALRSAKSAARRSGIGARFYSRQGDPAPSIARFAKTMHCNEIIMGTRGRSRVASFVLGSVALRVVQLSAVPVTLVK